MCGEPRSVRSCLPQGWFLHLRGLPNHDAGATASPPGIAPSAYREDRRARVEGPSEGRVTERMRRSLAPASGAYASGACRRRSPPRLPPDIRCHRRAQSPRRNRGNGTDRPRSSFRRSSAKSAAFQKARMPFTVTTREGSGSRGGMGIPPAFAPALPLTPPTLFPQAGDSALDGHCEATVRSPAGSVAASRVQTPF